MNGYRTPKLDGNRVVLKVRVPPVIHRAAHDRAGELNVSIADYVSDLIATDTGAPSPLDRPDEAQEEIHFRNTA